MATNNNSSHAPGWMASSGASRLTDNVNTSPASSGANNEEREHSVKSTAALKSELAKLEIMALNLLRLKYGDQATGDPSAVPNQGEVDFNSAAMFGNLNSLVKRVKERENGHLQEKNEHLNEENQRLNEENKRLHDENKRLHDQLSRMSHPATMGWLLQPPPAPIQPARR
jgi:hypothetical protein